MRMRREIARRMTDDDDDTFWARFWFSVLWAAMVTLGFTGTIVLGHGHQPAWVILMLMAGTYYTGWMGRENTLPRLSRPWARQLRREKRFKQEMRAKVDAWLRED